MISHQAEKERLQQEIAKAVDRHSRRRRHRRDSHEHDRERSEERRERRKSRKGHQRSRSRSRRRSSKRSRDASKDYMSETDTNEKKGRHKRKHKRHKHRRRSSSRSYSDSDVMNDREYRKRSRRHRKKSRSRCNKGSDSDDREHINDVSGQELDSKIEMASSELGLNSNILQNIHTSKSSYSLNELNEHSPSKYCKNVEVSNMSSSAFISDQSAALDSTYLKNVPDPNETLSNVFNGPKSLPAKELNEKRNDSKEEPSEYEKWLSAVSKNKGDASGVLKKLEKEGVVGGFAPPKKARASSPTLTAYRPPICPW